MDDEIVAAINKLTSKLVVMEVILRTLTVEALLERPDSIAAMRNYANKVETALV